MGGLVGAVRPPGYPQGPGSHTEEEEALLFVFQPTLPRNLYCQVLIILFLEMFGMVEFSMMI